MSNPPTHTPPTHGAAGDPHERFGMICLRCEREILARPEWIGREVQCPHCHSLMRVPPRQEIGRAVKAKAPTLGTRRMFNFPCPRCGSVLEAHTGMCGHHGRCPTCAARFIVPWLKRRSRLPERAQLLDDESETPVPLHAYAAEGVAAPKIVEMPGGVQAIECPQCRQRNPVDADACAGCRAPFTMDAAVTMGTLRSDTRSAATLALGVVGLLLFPLVVPSLLAVWIGARNLMDPEGARGQLSSTIGVALGVIALFSAAGFWYLMLK